MKNSRLASDLRAKITGSTGESRAKKRPFERWMNERGTSEQQHGRTAVERGKNGRKTAGTAADDILSAADHEPVRKGQKMAKKQHELKELKKRLSELDFSDESIGKFCQQIEDIEAAAADPDPAEMDLSDLDFTLFDDYEISLFDTDLDFLLN